MAQNFLACDRDQRLLLLPDLREWLPDGHLAWFVIEAVLELDLSGFCAEYREDGGARRARSRDDGGADAVLVRGRGPLLARDRASLREDVAFGVICAGAQPDHTTIARFRARHERALANLFAQVLALCAHSGLGSVGTVALDSTRIAADARVSRPGPMSGSRASCSRRRSGSMRRRTSSTARRAAMSCGPSSARVRAGGASCARRRPASTRRWRGARRRRRPSCASGRAPRPPPRRGQEADRLAAEARVRAPDQAEGPSHQSHRSRLEAGQDADRVRPGLLRRGGGLRRPPDRGCRDRRRGSRRWPARADGRGGRRGARGRRDRLPASDGARRRGYFNSAQIETLEAAGRRCWSRPAPSRRASAPSSIAARNRCC